jgi:hypothetical protein
MHAVAIELDFVQPRWPLRRCVDELGELRRDPVRQTGLLGARLARYPSRHAGSDRAVTAPAHAACRFLLGLSVGNREARPDRQGGELIDRIAASAPVRKLLFVEALGHARVPFSG